MELKNTRKTQALKAPGLYPQSGMGQTYREYYEALSLCCRNSLCSRCKYHQASCHGKDYPSFGNKKIEVQRNKVMFLKVDWQVNGRIRNKKNSVLMSQWITLFSNKMLTIYRWCPYSSSSKSRLRCAYQIPLRALTTMTSAILDNPDVILTLVYWI